MSDIYVCKSEKGFIKGLELNRGYLGFDSEVILKALEENIDWTKIKDIELLSKIELFDDSYFGCNYEINKKIVEQCILK